MPNPPPRLTSGGATPTASERRAASPTVAACVSVSASASSACDPAKICQPRQSAPASINDRARPAARSASTPKGLAPPPIRMPDPFRSKSGLTRTASRGVRPRFSAIASARRASPSDSRFNVTPASIAAASSSSRLPGPAKLTCAASIPASSARAISPPEATSKPSTNHAMRSSSAG